MQMKRSLLIIALVAASTLGAAAQSTLQQRITNDIKRASALKGAGVAVAVKDAKGNTLVAINADQRLVPASNLKLITTGTALHKLGQNYKFKTTLGYTGNIEDGTLNGDLYIIGGGDPTVGAKDSLVTNPAAQFTRWKAIMDKAGIKRINGRIIGDSRAWEGYLEFGDWTYEDVGTFYGAGSGALCFYKNAIDLKVAAGAAEGDPVQAAQSYPETPWMHFTNSAGTGKAGTGNSLFLYTTDLAPYSELRGSFALDRKPKTEHYANKFGALTCAQYFLNYLKAVGVEVACGAADIDRGGYLRGTDLVPAEKACEPVQIGCADSPTLADIVKETNFESDNFYAEAIFRTMGEEATGYAVYDSARVAEKSVLKKLGLNPEEPTIMDGSGLSRRSAVSARFMVDYLHAMTSSKAFPAFLASIPAPGQGTVKTLLNNNVSRGRFRLKSGSMEGVLCYSGYLLGDDGTPVASVSVLVNASTAKTAQIRKALEPLFEDILLYL